MLKHDNQIFEVNMIANHAYELIQALDLEPIKFKLMHAASGEAWSYNKVQAVEVEYRRFLYMIKMYPDEQLAPIEDVDTFWHYHILDTMKYAADCDALFGHFVHHHPYAGMAGDDDELAMIENADRTRDLYQRTFASPYPGTQPDGQAGAVAATPADGVEGAKAVYCVVAATSAYCVLAATPDHSELAAKPAYCVRTTKPADFELSSNLAYCYVGQACPFVLAVKPAYKVRAAKPANNAVN
jgi:hypothetical protein